jgi:hypothetical protein
MVDQVKTKNYFKESDQISMKTKNYFLLQLWRISSHDSLNRRRRLVKLGGRWRLIVAICCGGRRLIKFICLHNGWLRRFNALELIVCGLFDFKLKICVNLNSVTLNSPVRGTLQTANEHFPPARYTSARRHERSHNSAQLSGWSKCAII